MKQSKLFCDWRLAEQDHDVFGDEQRRIVLWLEKSRAGSCYDYRLVEKDRVVIGDEQNCYDWTWTEQDCVVIKDYKSKIVLSYDWRLPEQGCVVTED
jgi:hypothetical protein